MEIINNHILSVNPPAEISKEMHYEDKKQQLEQEIKNNKSVDTTLFKEIFKEYFYNPQK